VGDSQYRLLLRSPRDVDSREEGLSEGAAPPRRLGLDAAVVPALLLLVARDLLTLDPPRVLAWRLLHDPQLSRLGGWAAALVPRPLPELDRDPIALVLATSAVLLAAVYLVGTLMGGGARFRAGVLALGALVLVVAPTVGFMAMGHVMGRPYGQDGGVVQLPLAIDKILSGQSPYAADYSDSILAREARASRFWAGRGGNPILRHHAYLPGTHLLMMPFHLAARAAGVTFDPRLVTLLAYGLAAWLAAGLVAGVERRLTAAALVLVNPLVYWHQIFGANDIVFVAMVLGVALLLKRGRVAWAAVLLGVACGTKQLAWPFAPFLMLIAAGARWPVDDWRAPVSRLVRLGLVVVAVFAVVVLPIAALDFRAFYADIVGYNVGLPGADNYPLGGTPGFGFANYLIYFGAVRSLGDYVPFGLFYLLLIPLGLLLARATAQRRAEPAFALVMGGVALLASLYFSRVVHPNYLLPLAVLLPIGAIGASLAADVVIVPLLLGAVAVEIAQQAPLRLVWQDAVAARLPEHVSGAFAWLLPRGGPDLTDDPLSLLWSATAAGFALVALCAGVLGATPRARALVAAAAVGFVVVAPAWAVIRIGERTGTVRAQDEWVPEVRAAVDRVMGREAASPPTREAWSTSFREEPARLLEARPWFQPGAAAWLAVPLRLFGRDPRVLLIVAVVALAALLVLRGWNAPALLGLALLVSPPVATSVVFGGGHVLAALAMAFALVVMSRRGTLGRGLAYGLAVSTSTPALTSTALLAEAESHAEARRRVAWPWLAGLVLGWIPLGATSRAGDFVSLVSIVGPGFGLANFWTCWGVEPRLVVGVAWAGAILGAVVLARRTRSGAPLLFAAGAASLLVLLAMPYSAPDAVLVPLTLLAIAAARSDG
jgi:hypothetical protein